MSLSSQAYNLIRQDILTCSLAPGQQINQSEIAEKYQLGITPVREALTRLSHEGLVSSLPRFGYLVSPVTLSDLNELFEFRVILETAAVKLAVVKAHDDQLLNLGRMADFSYHYREVEDYGKFLARNSAFHVAIARLSGNQRLSETLSGLLDQLTRFFYLGLDLRDSAEEMRSEHMELTRVLVEKNEAGAVALIIHQIERSRQRILEALQNSRYTSGLPPHPVHVD